jgi:hypothetical protein
VREARGIAMNMKKINPLLFIGFIGIFTIGSHFFVNIYTAFFDNKDIYWTHQSYKLPIENTETSFQVFISGKRLQKHLDEHTLLAVDPTGNRYPVVSKDVTARINNWYQVQSKRLAMAVLTGFAFGITLTLFVTGLIQTLVRRKQAH